MFEMCIKCTPPRFYTLWTHLRAAAWLWILMNVFFPFSNTFRVKRSPKKSPLSDLSQVGSEFFIHLDPVTPVLYLTLPASPYCRIQRWRMKPPPTHRTTTPPTKRSWPPPPVTSGLPCRMWMQNWTLTNKTFLSRVTSHPSLTKTVFLIRLQVRLSCPALFKCTCLCTHTVSK